MKTHPDYQALRLISSLGVCLAAATSSACASFPLSMGARTDQLTAALTEFNEGVRGEVVLDPKTLGRFRTVEDGQAPKVFYEGRHQDGWLDEVVALGLADRLCTADRECEASKDVTVISLSRPYSGRNTVLIDAQLKQVTDTGYGLIRSTNLFRLQISENDSGWRVVASTPVWETSG